MAVSEQAKWVVPNPQICRSFGLMNIIFGALLLLFGATTAVVWAVAPTFQKKMMASFEEQQAQRKAEREAKLAEFKKNEEAAKTQEEKDAIKDQREALEKQFEPDLAAMNEFTTYNMFSDLRLAVYYIAELSAAIILNILMIISGAGLLAMADWARRLAVGVSWLKIVRWIVMTVVTLVLVLPITMDLTQKALARMDQQIKAQSGGRPLPVPLSALGPVQAIAGAAVTVFSAVVSSIYPALAIWFLTRPAARAACLRESVAKEAARDPGVGEPW
jgi:hypothetical protein